MGAPEAEPGMFEIIINSKGVPKLYVEGNRGPHRADDRLYDWSLVSYMWGQQVAPAHYRAPTRFETWPITASSADDAFPAVLARAGGTRPKHDAVDARVVAQVEKGTGKIINSPAEVAGYPRLTSGTPPMDSDHDGMPDEWEKTHGLDLADPSDATGDLDKDGDTNIEEFLNATNPAMKETDSRGGHHGLAFPARRQDGRQPYALKPLFNQRSAEEVERGMRCA